MLAEPCVARNKTPDADPPGDQGGPIDPLFDGGDAEDPKYTEHLKVPLPFMERLESIAQKINRRRRRTGRRKRALGWFVVTHLAEWMDQAEAELADDPE